MRQRDRRDYRGLSFFLQKCIVCMVALRRIAGTIRVSVLPCDLPCGQCGGAIAISKFGSCLQSPNGCAEAPMIATPRSSTRTKRSCERELTSYSLNSEG